METAISEHISSSHYYSASSNNNTTILDITPVRDSQLSLDLKALYPTGIVRSQLWLKGLECRANISSLANFVLPLEVEDGFSSQIKANRAYLTALWSQERREFNLYQQISTEPWRLRGAVALPNKLRSGAYYLENLLNVLSFDGDSYPLGVTEKVGIGLATNTWGLLSTNDEILISANWELKHWVMI
jgi:hypothetical protein